MPDKSHEASQNTSKPFLASDEVHEAVLMVESKDQKSHNHVDHSPAPILPSILDHSEETKPEHNAHANMPFATMSPEPLTDDSDHPPLVHYPSTKKAIVGLTIAVVLLTGLSAVWYSLNQDVYTLGNESPKKTAANTSSKSNPETLGAETNKSGTLTATFKNLPKLDQGHYQLWAQSQGKNQSLGGFTLTNTGALVNLDNTPFNPKFQPGNSQSILFVTIEGGNELASQPSKSILLTGNLQDGTATLSFAAVNLSQANGVFTLAAPTEPNGESQTSGIWLAKTDGRSLTAAGLNAPQAPEGWSYEAQVKYKDQIVAIGRFTNPNSKDSLSIFTPNSDLVPNYPGEDYLEGAPSRLGLEFPTNLATGEWKLIVSIEPDQGGTDPTGDDIFFLQPFTADIVKDAEAHKEYPLKLDITSFPSGTITLK